VTAAPTGLLAERAEDRVTGVPVERDHSPIREQNLPSAGQRDPGRGRVDPATDDLARAEGSPDREHVLGGLMRQSLDRLGVGAGIGVGQGQHPGTRRLGRCHRGTVGRLVKHQNEQACQRVDRVCIGEHDIVIDARVDRCGR
jgi:hypothetical protein